MEKLKSLTLLCLLTLLLLPGIEAQTSNCGNLAGELGNFTNWTGYTWQHSIEGRNKPWIDSIPAEGFVVRRHTIITDRSATDEFTGGALRKIPEGYNQSIRLGDAIYPDEPYVWDPTSPMIRCWNQSLRYEVDVDANNALLIVKFALVLQYDPDHDEVDSPRFMFTLYDETGDVIPGCANYDVYAAPHIDGFQNYEYGIDGDEIINWRDWTAVGFDLTPYAGRTITVEFMSRDCAGTYDFGYAYFVASCQPLEINVNYCDGDAVATFNGPDGFEAYRWTNESGVTVGTERELNVTNPEDDDEYFLELTSATGCVVPGLATRVVKFSPKAEFTSEMVDCDNNTVQITNLSSTNISGSTMSYLWDFGDGNTSRDVNPRYSFDTPGMHPVSLRILNRMSTTAFCVKTFEERVESFARPMVNILPDKSTYCPNNSLVLEGYGASTYNWIYASVVSEEDTFAIGDPGGEVGLIGFSADSSCISDTIRRTFTEAIVPDYNVVGDTGVCEGDNPSTTLFAPNGFDNYRWVDGDSAFVSDFQIFNPVEPDDGEKYTCYMSGTLCPSSCSTTIVVYNPIADFSSEIINCESNEASLINTSSFTNGTMQYLWNFGEADNDTSTSENLIHRFIASGRHTVRLEVTNPPSTCSSVLEKEIESFSKPLVGILREDSTYCPGKSVLQKGYGAYRYEWSNGAEEDSIEVNAPGGEFWLIGYSNEGGCISDTAFITVTEEPYWELTIIGDTLACEGDSTELVASGAVEFIWNEQDTVNSVFVSPPDTCYITARNINGCVKSKTFPVTVSYPPAADFSVSEKTITTRDNEVIITIPPEDDVEYEWDLDDGSTNTGSTINHAYQISYDKLYYDVLLYATNKYGCKSSSVEGIDVIPYVPNVFSPNGDGINDVFMPDIDLEVFDRNGAKLYKGTEGWDGTHNGKQVSQDTYFYSIKYSSRGDVEHKLKGYLTLVK